MLLCVRSPPTDLPTGSYIQEDLSRCSSLCEAGKDCCDLMASCKCGAHTGQYDCICEKGYYGKGLQHECTGEGDGDTVLNIRFCLASVSTQLVLLYHYYSSALTSFPHQIVSFTDRCQLIPLKTLRCKVISYKTSI